ncbi:MAG TPA: PHB depolymerase family esterase, partial [Polyangiaceae bacterium]|nr:PHB depolymerase family esterase [Polyangiaceae bacterium]
MLLHRIGFIAALASCLPQNDLSVYSDGADPQTQPARDEAEASPPSDPSATPGANGGDPSSTPSRPSAPGVGAAPVGAETQPLGRPDASSADAGAFGSAALTGVSALQLTLGGTQRTFLYYAPAALDPSVPVPVLIVAHGLGQSAAQIFEITRFDALAEREGFVVLYPEGQGRIPWNIGADVCPGARGPVFSARGDDSAFVDAMLAFVAKDRRIDADHVFVAGFASGGYLANELACERTDIRAVASHSGGTHALDACRSAQKPVLLLHGLSDAAVPARCSDEARERWVEHNGCASDSDERAVLGGSCSDARGCPEGGQVSQCNFEGMGQGWAGGAAQAESFLRYAAASELIWEFFRTHA